MSYPIYLLYFISFVDLFAVGLLIPLLGNHARELGASHVLVGLMGSLYSGCQLASSPLIGSLSDLKGRRGTLAICLLLCSAAYVLMGFTTSIAILLFLRVFLGIFKQTQMLTKALVPDYEGDENRQSIIYGKMAAISGCGITVGPIFGGHIQEELGANGFLINTVLASSLFIVNAGLLWLLKWSSWTKVREPKTSLSVPADLLTRAWDSLKQSALEIYKIDWTIFWEVFLFKAIVGFCMGVYYSSYFVLLKSQFELSPKHIGYTISFQGIIGSICSYCIAYVNSFYKDDHDYTKRNFHCFILMTASLIGLSMAVNIYMFVPWLVPLAMSNAVGRLISLEMILKKSSGEHRGTLIGASNSVRSLSGVVAPVLGGIIMDYYGSSFVLLAAICSSMIGLILSMRTRARGQIRVDNVKVD